MMTTLTPAAITFERILVPTDFSDASRSALAYAKRIANEFQSQLFLAHVNQSINPATPPEATWIDEESIQQQLEEQMEQAGAALRAEGIRAEAFSVIGAIQDEILALIGKNKIDLVVMGTHSKTGLERFIFGSDAEAVLRKASCPVLIVGPQAVADPKQPWHPRSLICATTLEPDSAWIAAYALRLAQQYQAEFMLFHIEAPGKNSGETDLLLFESELRKSLPNDASYNKILKTLISDRPGHEIADVARERHADLIVMGARTASSFATHLNRGTVSRVFAEAPCPVMTFHQ